MLKSLARGAQVLQCFTPEAPSLALTEIAAKLDVPKGSVFRLVSTLESLGFLEQDPLSKRYRLGVKVLALGQAYLSGLEYPDVALPHLEELALDYQTAYVDFHAPEGVPETYRRIQPHKKVPAVQVGGLTITERAAMTIYLADRFSGTASAAVSTLPVIVIVTVPFEVEWHTEIGIGEWCPQRRCDTVVDL